MTPKQYLLQVQLQDIKIDHLLEELARWEALATNVTPTLDKLNVQTSEINRQEKAYIKVIELRDRVNAQIDLLVDKKEEVRAVVDQLTDPTYLQVIYKRYFEYSKHGGHRLKSLEDIAVEMGYTERQIYNIHGIALSEIGKIIKECSGFH